MVLLHAIGLPQISVTDLGLNFGGPSGFPQGRFVTTYVFSDTVNYLKSKHSIKIGGEFRRFQGNNFANTAGTVNFTTTANFINGLTNTYTANSINPVTNRIFISAVGAFAEDSYKVTPTLTLEYGLRYEWNGTPAEGGHRFITFNPTTSAFQQVNQPYKQNNNYEPRVGFIYDVSGKGKTTVRGGFGYLVDQPIISAVTGLASNPPLSNPLADYRFADRYGLRQCRRIRSCSQFGQSKFQERVYRVLQFERATRTRTCISVAGRLYRFARASSSPEP